MSLEEIQNLVIEPIDNSIIKRDFLNVYHQQGTKLNQSYQNIDTIFRKLSDYHQTGSAYLEFDITVRRNDNAAFDDDSATRLTNNGLAYVFKK